MVEKELFGPGLEGFKVIFVGNREEVEDTFEFMYESVNVVLRPDFKRSSMHHSLSSILH
jgi:hypothetical protein